MSAALDVEHMGIVDTSVRYYRKQKFVRYPQAALSFSIIMVPAGTALVVDFIRQLQLRIQVRGIHIAGQIGRTVIDPGIFVNLAAVNTWSGWYPFPG